MSPTQRTRKKLLDEGWVSQIVEHFNPWGRCRVDLFGVIDILAMKEGERLLGIQTTTGSNLSARVKKILQSDRANLWVKTGNRLEIWAWRKLKGRWKEKITKFVVLDWENLP